MALTVLSNSGALMAQAAASSVNKSMENSMERLATGKRLNSAADDAAGVAIASRLTSEIRGTNMAIRNAMDGQAMIDTAEGAHVEVENILQRVRELSVQSANDSNNSQDRANLQLEVDALMTEIDRIARTTTWAGQGLLNGAAGSDAAAASAHTDSASFTFAVGSGSNAADAITTNIGAISSAAIGIGGTGIATSSSAAETGPARMVTSADGTISILGAIENGDIFTVSVNDIDITATYSITDGYTNNAAGVAAQLKDVIDAKVTAGATNDALGEIVVTNNGDGSIKLTMATSPLIDTIAESAAAGSGALTLTNNTLTVTSGTWATADTLTVNINNETVAVALAATHTQTNIGAAAALKSAIEDKSGLEGVSVVDNGDGSVTVTQSTSPTIRAAEVTLKNAATSTLEYDNVNKLTVGGSFVAGKNFSFDLYGKNISVTTSTSDSYDDSKAGVARQIAAAINDAGIHGVTASKTANENTVTLVADVAVADAVVNKSGTATNKLVTTVGDSTTATIHISSSAGGVASAAYATGDSFTFKVADEEFTLVVGTDGFADSHAGIALQLKDLIEDADIDGIVVTADGGTSAGVKIHRDITATKSGGSTVAQNIVVMDGASTSSGSPKTAIDVGSKDGANAALTRVDAALELLSAQRASLGATSNRLDSTVSNLTNISANLSAGRGRIEDADFAAETTNLAKMQILQQASTAMLAQANASKQNVLSLLQG